MVVCPPAALGQLVVPAVAEAEQPEDGGEQQDGQGHDDGDVGVGQVVGEHAALVVAYAARVVGLVGRRQVLLPRRRQLQLDAAVAEVPLLAALADVAVVQLEAGDADEGALDGHQEGPVDAARAADDLVGVALAPGEGDEADAVGLAGRLVAVARVAVALEEAERGRPRQGQRGQGHDEPHGAHRHCGSLDRLVYIRWCSLDPRPITPLLDSSLVHSHMNLL